MPKYPKKELAQLLLQICVAHGIEKVVISPGSRNAPLTLGFVNHPDIKTFSIVDERSAAFFALGMAQQDQKTVALLCTSGSALLNYYPAIAEAYYSRIPLLILSADRPKHLIDIGYGQTIRQEAVFSNHICFETCLIEEGRGTQPSGDDLQKVNGINIKKALTVAKDRMGPVHINIPFAEPLYETVSELYDFTDSLIKQASIATESLLDETPWAVSELEKFASKWNRSPKKMVLIGSLFPDELIQIQMDHLIKDPSVIILTETISNIHGAHFIDHIDQLIFPLGDEEFNELKPDVLLTFGGMVVSKRIKQFLRNYQPEEHWHIDALGSLDTFDCLSQYFNISPQLFFSQFFFLTEQLESSYQKRWLLLKNQRGLKHKEYLKDIEYSDMSVFDSILNTLPSHIYLQLANSSVVRYTQLFDMDPSIHVFCNRGTSGIDGSTSTALGAAFTQKKQTVFITGDVSFFYDSNALWNSYVPQNFRIILVNNSGGGIFRIIPGPKDSDALDFFETTHNLNASYLCEMHDFDYHSVNDSSELKTALTSFYVNTGKPALLEIFTPNQDNDRILKDYFEFIK